MDLLEPHFRSGLGVALIASNGMYLSRNVSGTYMTWPYEDYYTSILEVDEKDLIVAERAYKDPQTKFTMEHLRSNVITMKSGGNNKYLSVIHRDHRNNEMLAIYADKSTPDLSCEFEVFDVEGKLVLKSVEHKRYVKRILRDGQLIELVNQGIDEHSSFTLDTAAITPVREEIISLTFGNASNLADLQPSIVSSKTGNNEGSEKVEMELTMEWSYTESSETTWEHGWGVTTGISTSADFKVFGIGASMEFNLEVNYNGKKGGNAGQERTTTISETTKVIVPPGKKVTAYLIIQKKDDVTVPFEATIKRTSEIGTFEFVQKGVWRGVIKFSSHVTVKESDLGEDTSCVCM